MIFSLSVEANGSTTSGPIMDLETGPNNRVALKEIMVEAVLPASGSSADIAIGISSNAPVASYKQTLQSEHVPGVSSFSSVASIWTTAPAIPANFFRRGSFAQAVAGRFFIWTFPRGLILAPSTSLVLWQAGNAQTHMICSFVIEE